LNEAIGDADLIDTAAGGSRAKIPGFQALFEVSGGLTMFRRIATLSLFLGTLTLAQAPGRGGAAAPIIIKQVPNKTGLYVVTGGGGASTVRVTPEGVIVVDTKNLGEANYNALMDQIKTVSMAPVRYAVITHVHQDHSGNSDWFQKAGTQVVAHENLRKNLETYTSAQGKPAVPNAIYSGASQTLRVGNAQAVVHHFGAGHTSGDSYVYFPDLRTVSTGDAFAGAALNCDYAQGGSILSWARALDALLKLDFDTVIAGHTNDPLTKADVQAAQARLAKTGTVAIDLVKKGTPKDQIVAAVTAADSTLNLGALLQNNAVRLDAFYAEVQAAAK
jgi:glyoxylase-like metal-dependent hydrolase (beta-lactamase superfamily II)